MRLIPQVSRPFTDFSRFPCSINTKNCFWFCSRRVEEGWGPKGRAAKYGGREGWGPRRVEGAQNFALYFPSLEGLLVEFWPCLKRRDPQSRVQTNNIPQHNTKMDWPKWDCQSRPVFRHSNPMECRTEEPLRELSHAKNGLRSNQTLWFKRGFKPNPLWFKPISKPFGEALLR